MKKNLRPLALAFSLAFAITATGCIGKFALTRKLYAFNEKVTGSKIINSVIFWAFLALPVYEIAFAADWIILNTLDALNGSNPVASGDGRPVERVAVIDGRTVKLTLTDGGARLRVEVSGGGEATRLLELTAGEASATLAVDGAPAWTAALDGDGSLELRDAHSAVQRRVDAGELARLSEAARHGPAAFLAEAAVARGANVATSR